MQLIKWNTCVHTAGESASKELNPFPWSLRIRRQRFNKTRYLPLWGPHKKKKNNIHVHHSPGSSSDSNHINRDEPWTNKWEGLLTFLWSVHPVLEIFLIHIQNELSFLCRHVHSFTPRKGRAWTTLWNQLQKNPPQIPAITRAHTPHTRTHTHNESKS